MGMDSVTQYDDKELFQLIAGGHKAAFTQLFKKYTPQLTSFIHGFTKSDCITDEIVQEIFMRIWFTREKLTAINEPGSYIFRTTAMVCHSFLKQLLIDNKIISVVRHESYYGSNEVFETARLYSLAANFQDAVKELGPQQKKVYTLSREKGLKVPEIADELSLSPNNVRTLLSSSIESIHDYLQNKGHSLIV
jgi:RNA polymerase sigma factor (sigma-70 family)